MHNDVALTEGRIQRFAQDYLLDKDVVETRPVTIEIHRLDGEPIPPREGIALSYEPANVGDALGRAWSTVWLHVTGDVPAEWGNDPHSASELIVDLDFSNQPGFQAEAHVFTPDGVPVKAINPFNHYVPVEPGQPLDLFIECAANPNVSGSWTFAPTPWGDPENLPEDVLYTIKTLHVVRRDTRIWELAEDFKALGSLMRELPEKSQRRHEILRALEDAMDAADPDDMPGTAEAAREVLRPALERPAAASAMTVVATGHAHIDSAWLWPVRETVRKVARTFSNVCHLIETDEEITFSASSAQQYKWLKDRYPELFERIREHVRSGRFIPVGGMWVESDTNMPGSEAMARQFVAGKRFFLENFDVETTETWLPDSFGYSAALPQIAELAGHEFFLTQKVSWNQINTFPHHTFRWEGLDGTTQFTHFPPADTYNGNLGGKELAYIEQNFKDKGRASMGIDLFGWGDGGGGPTREMMAAGRRAHDLEGSPRVEFGTARDFFERAREEYPDAPVWNGELYLELHRGTYSAQPATKQGNRRNEHRLHEAEFLATLASLRTDFEYPYEELEEIWHITLLNQFHDILPGSSIAWVHRDAELTHADVTRRADAIIESALAALGHDSEASEQALLNTAPVARYGVGAYAAAAAQTGNDDRALEGGADTAAGVGQAATVSRDGEHITLANGSLSAVIDDAGDLISLRDAVTGREAIAPGAKGALLQLHRDTPNAWDAWDIDEFYRRVVRDLDAPTNIEIVEDNGEARVICTYSTTVPDGQHSGGVTGAGSAITQTYVLRPGDESLQIVHDIDWKERKKALKLAFPLDVRAPHMSSEIQFGHVQRPIPVNTSWDYARWETCAHRWVHLAEGDYGVAIANDSSYGHDVLRTLRPADGGTTTTARVTLIRSPEFPDPRADHGQYTFTVTVRPGAGIAGAITEGYRVNLPQRQVAASALEKIGGPLLSVDSPTVLVETIKLAEDRSGDLVVRLYESEGVRSTATVRFDDAVDASSADVVDLLERPFSADKPAFRSALEHGDDHSVELSFGPFEIKTLRISRR